ncbi:MAG: hypothetical protein Q9187_008465 [Circinaria calcarea]
MLGPHFAEGSTIKNGMLDVDMPEDDTEAMITLCGILHHRYECTTSSPSTEFLIHLATTADKYDCVSAVSQWSGNHISDLILKAEIQENLDYRLLYLTYAFDDHRRFRQITKLLVYSRSGTNLHDAAHNCSGLMDTVDKPSLWMKVIAKILTTQENTMRCLLDELQGAMTPMLKKPLLNNQPSRGLDPKSAASHNDTYFSECDSTHISRYLSTLHWQDIWPLAQHSATWGLDTILSNLDDCNFQTATQHQTCIACKTDFTLVVRRAKDKVKNAFFGLCLDCVKNGEPVRKQGRKCRLAHRVYQGV